ncbi:endonuclease/exonuclease/phosphatase family protein [Pseudonocardia halophobica]|uniref:endonuclease/exonuclease/phosphatase family protein n=1 Tax=Pseudonocardia halophobica TaxID=29401 RepID=UPI003D91977C
MSAPPGPFPPAVPTARPGSGPPPPRTPEPGYGGGGRRPRRGLGGRVVGAVLLAVAASVFTVPDLWSGLDRWSPFTQVVAFRAILLVVVTVVALALALVTLGMRRMWPFPLAMLAVVAVTASTMVPRMSADPVPTGGTPVKVLSFNVYTGDADVRALVDLIHRERPDLIALPEAGERYRQKLAPLIEDLGYRTDASVDRRSQDVNGVVAAVSPRFGDVTFDIGKITEDSPFPYVQVSGGEMGDLTFVAFHSVAPTAGSVAQWRQDLAGVSRWCSAGSPAIVAGDFNATLDHSVLRGATADCGDAAAQRGAALTATWPAMLPRWLGAEIDHVFANQGATSESFEVLDLPGSDHRAILTTLRLP